MVTQNILISLFDFRISFAISKGDTLGIPSIESVRCITYRDNSFNPFKQDVSNILPIIRNFQRIYLIPDSQSWFLIRYNPFS